MYRKLVVGTALVGAAAGMLFHSFLAVMGWDSFSFFQLILFSLFGGSCFGAAAGLAVKKDSSELRRVQEVVADRKEVSEIYETIVVKQEGF